MQKLGTEIAQLANMAKRGYIIAIVQYRETDIASFPTQVKEVKSAVAYLIDHADEYRIDCDKIFLWGDSSGGHTSLMVAATDGNPNFTEEGCEVETLPIKPIVDFYGVIDITTLNNDLSIQDHTTSDCPEGMLIGRKPVKEHLDLAQLTNPVNYMSKERMFPPVLIIHGGKDRWIPFSQSVYLYESFKELDKEVPLYKLEGADHGRAPFWTEALMVIVDEFLRKYVK